MEGARVGSSASAEIQALVRGLDPVDWEQVRLTVPGIRCTDRSAQGPRKALGRDAGPRLRYRKLAGNVAPPVSGARARTDRDEGPGPPHACQDASAKGDRMSTLITTMLVFDLSGLSDVSVDREAVAAAAAQLGADAVELWRSLMARAEDEVRRSPL